MNERSYRADVVVIGGGIAGISTALDLLDQGKTVALIDSRTEAQFGGLAISSFGGLFFVGTPEQRRVGVHDSVDLALDDWFRYAEFEEGDRWPKEWATAYVHECTDRVRRWIDGHGVGLFPVVNWTERGYFVPGNSVPRFHIAWGTGLGLTQALILALRGHKQADKLQLYFEHTVADLDQQGGRFVGCHGTTSSGEGFTARGEAVVIAAGGIAGSLAKVREVWPRKQWGEPPADMLNGSFPEANGKMLEAAQGHGARATHLSKMWNYAAGVKHWKPEFEGHGLSLVPMKSPLWVDYTGRRFVDPPLVGTFDTLMLVDQICRTKKAVSWTVLNMGIAKREFAVSGAEFNPDIRDKKFIAFVLRMLMGNKKGVRLFTDQCEDFLTGSSVRELAGKMNALTGTQDVVPDLLEAEVLRYDNTVKRKKGVQNDDQLRRIAHARQWRGDKLRTAKNAFIDDPRNYPLIAIRNRILTRKSLGGLQVDLDCRVLDQAGEPMPGLYSVGEACGFGGGGMHGKRALEGTFLGGCMYSGRRCAEALKG